ncbi:L-aspartate 1-decarboxylase [Natranaerovirga pectinivora]|uniref:Aspartate 1-decarboxylase n=1 Tax=Natranaerovirga pectinivora TaxID=682400 RepID=A0A4R3MJJ6_9FIRM|nr:aspartate 1-decarboxylase [Natranaerovirga pectinivora]TCT13855.1 L-aspartate 1-decarboxylase [Natranaerovirga pectinivora]
MLIEMMTGKIHRATVTDANLNYVGSITIDENLLKATGILPNQKVQVVNNNNGARFETYVISGQAGSGTICLNGAASRLAQPGDIVIIIAYGLMDSKEAVDHKPKVILVDGENRIEKIIEGEDAPETMYDGIKE